MRALGKWRDSWNIEVLSFTTHKSNHASDSESETCSGFNLEPLPRGRGRPPTASPSVPSTRRDLPASNLPAHAASSRPPRRSAGGCRRRCNARQQRAQARRSRRVAARESAKARRARIRDPARGPRRRCNARQQRAQARRSRRAAAREGAKARRARIRDPARTCSKRRAGTAAQFRLSSSWEFAGFVEH